MEDNNFLFQFSVHGSLSPCLSFSSASFITPESRSLTRQALNLLSTLDFAVRHSKVEAEALEKDRLLLSWCSWYHVRVPS